MTSTTAIVQQFNERLEFVANESISINESFCRLCLQHFGKENSSFNVAQLSAHKLTKLI